MLSNTAVSLPNFSQPSTARNLKLVMLLDYDAGLMLILSILGVGLPNVHAVGDSGGQRGDGYSP